MTARSNAAGPVFRGLGPMPGLDTASAADIIAGESHNGQLVLPILPQRGLGADAIGRTGAILADINLDRGPRSWVVSARPSRQTWAARDFLDRDLDACEEMWGSAPSRIRLVVTGPWTLAASIERPGGHLVLADAGATDFFAQSLAHGVAEHAADIRRRFDCDVDVFLDEPLLGAVRSGAIEAPTTGAGGAGFLPAQGRIEIAAKLRTVVETLSAVDIDVVIGPGSLTDIEPVIFSDAGAPAVWITADNIADSHPARHANLDACAAILGSAITLDLGALPAKIDQRDQFSGAPVVPNPRLHAQKIARLWDTLGFSRADMLSFLDLSPRAGFAECSSDEPSALLKYGRDVADLIGRAAGDL